MKPHPHRPHHIHPPDIKSGLRATSSYFLAAVQWIPLAALVGLSGGAVGLLFHLSIHAVTEWRLAHPWIVWLLPVGALLILGIYRMLRILPEMGTNLILESVRAEERVPILLMPAIFLGTVATHLFGGSAGREGAALQIGGSVAFGFTRLFRVQGEARHLIILCGMAAVFSALFGTPVTAMFFVLEVISVGRFYYSAMIPVLTASLVAYYFASSLGGEVVRMELPAVGEITPLLLGQTALLALLCALLSILFCVAVHRVGHVSAKFIPNVWLRALLLGTLLLGMTLLSGGQAYNGAGMDYVMRAVEGETVPWYAFLLKLAFTAVTLAAGYKGGEIVPTFFVGAAFGGALGPLLGMDSGLAAGLCMVGLFCGVVNCPVASIFLAVEVFGGTYLVPFVLTCAISYILSGYFGLYSSQHILRSKVGAELIDRNTME